MCSYCELATCLIVPSQNELYCAVGRYGWVRYHYENCTERSRYSSSGEYLCSVLTGCREVAVRTWCWLTVGSISGYGASFLSLNMLTFLRKIRRSLVESGGTRKYLLYAVGEVLLVMIGILLALQVNTWNENRKLAKEEKVLLEAIYEEFLFNKTELSRAIQVAQVIQERCLTLLQNTGPDRLSLSKSESDSLIFRGFRRIITFDVSNGIVNDLLNTGKVHLLRNDELRKKLANWPSHLQDCKEDEQWAVEYRNNHINPFLVQHYYMNLPYGPSAERVSTGFDVNYRNIYKMAVFENLVNLHRHWNWRNEQNYERVQVFIKEILELCESELKSKDVTWSAMEAG